MRKFSHSSIVVILMLFVLRASAAVLYVDVNTTNPVPPYSDLTSAAVTIQDAADIATNGDLILVNDGVYEDGFRTIQESVTTSSPPYQQNYSVTNRLVVTNALNIQSINGPSAAFISGGGMYRCVYLSNRAVLSGFTLMNGVAGWIYTTQSLRGNIVTKTNAFNGGGVACPTVWGSSPVWVSNCVLTANMAYGNGGGADGVNLRNCTLTGNTATSGGGACDSTLSHCLVTGNTANATGPIYNMYPGTYHSIGILPASGGGIYGGSALNCIVANNTAFAGGGVYGASKLVNCTIVKNSAAFYGGMGSDNPGLYTSSSLTNCLVYFNAAGTNANYGTTNFSMDHCCTFPLPSSGVGNFTNDPTLLDVYGGDFHLQSNSPCCNSGINAGIANSTDLDGNPRIVGGTVDIGAYEFQSPKSVLSYAWDQKYGLPTDGSADFMDSDGDGMNNWQEFLAGTNPTNAASVLKITTVYPIRTSLWAVVKWQSVSSRSYFLQRCSSLSSGFMTIQSNLAGADGTTIYFDTTATNATSFFYRVGVQ